MEGGSGQQHDSGCDITTARAPRESARAPRKSRVTASRQAPTASRQPPAASRQPPTVRRQNQEAQAIHWFDFGKTGNNRKMLRTPAAHYRIQKHKQPIGYVSVTLAKKGNAAHIQHTLHNTESQATRWFHFVQTRNNCKMLRTPNAHCQRQKHKQFIVTRSNNYGEQGRGEWERSLFYSN